MRIVIKNIAIDEARLLLLDEKKAYLAKLKTTPEERGKVRSWVNRGNSVYANPWLLYSESGYPMDFISAMRAIGEMENFEPYNPYIDISDDESSAELPF
jgi:hypothetical protein